MNIRKHAVFLAAASLVLSALLVARAPARASAPKGHERSARAALADAVMCVEVPANPPPCATPKSAVR